MRCWGVSRALKSHDMITTRAGHDDDAVDEGGAKNNRKWRILSK